MNYYYLVSSLPMINFSQGCTVAITLEKLTELCRENLTGEDMKIFDSVALVSENGKSLSKVVNAFFDWDTNLRNAIVNYRVGSQLAHKYKHEERNYYAEIDVVVQEALSKGNALEREIFIDSARAKKIDDLSAGHQFDIEFLSAYKLKLILATKYSKLSAEAGEKNFNDLVEEIIKNK